MTKKYFADLINLGGGGGRIGGSLGAKQIVKNVLSAVFFMAGIISVIMIILGGINYSTSQGDSGKVKKAKDSILYGVIGLVVSLSAFAIIQFAINSIN